MPPLELVLFDLDGTLVDTAPDLAAIANALRADRGLPALPLAALRPFASQGARGLIGRALDVAPGDADFERLRTTFLDRYAEALCVASALFPGMDTVLAALEAADLRWGIVTNKAARFTEPLVRALGLDQRAACVVSGDTTPHAKPHPAPIRAAMSTAKATPDTTWYVGDDARDITAGRAAGTETVAAAYGYLGGDASPAQWGADHQIESPTDLLQLRRLAAQLRSTR